MANDDSVSGCVGKTRRSVDVWKAWGNTATHRLPSLFQDRTAAIMVTLHIIAQSPALHSGCGGGGGGNAGGDQNLHRMFLIEAQ